VRRLLGREATASRTGRRPAVSSSATIAASKPGTSSGRVEHPVEELVELDRGPRIAQEAIALALSLGALQRLREVAAEIVHARAHLVDRATSRSSRGEAGFRRPSATARPTKPRRATAAMIRMMVVPLEIAAPQPFPEPQSNRAGTVREPRAALDPRSLSRPGVARARGSRFRLPLPLPGGGTSCLPALSVPREEPPTDFEEQRAHRQSARSQGAQVAQGEGQDPRASRRAAEAGRVHARLHDDAEEAELRAAQGRAREADEPDGGRRVHPGRGAQPAGALGRADPRRPRQGPAGVPLQGDPRRARHLGCRRPPPGPLEVRREEGRS
jgi:hypothetical protein